MNTVKGTLIKPLDQQNDRDGVKIDPDGVLYDPDRWYTIHYDFRYDVPPIGRAKVYRGKDGGLYIQGELFSSHTGAKFSFGGAINETDANQVVRRTELLEVGLTMEHSDPNQPEIEVDDVVGR